VPRSVLLDKSIHQSFDVVFALGSNVFHPNRSDALYRIVFKFDRRSNLEKWENSPERAKWRVIAESVCQARKVETITGLEAWFTLPDCAINVHPPKYKMAFLVWLGVSSLVALLSYLLGRLISDWTLVARSFTHDRHGCLNTHLFRTPFTDPCVLALALSEEVTRPIRLGAILGLEPTA
jgi:antibiotic biosynthesis monooxygenase (ABM) superfamily enzyme